MQKAQSRAKEVEGKASAMQKKVENTSGKVEDVQAKVPQTPNLTSSLTTGSIDN